MTPAFRIKLALLAIASVLATTFVWNAAQGQFWPPRNPPQGMQGDNGPANIFTCPNCGYVYRGMVPPSICPGCKMRMNNGMGDGVDGPQGPANPPEANPGDRNADGRPFFIAPPPKDGTAVLNTAGSSDSKWTSKRLVVIAVVVGVVAGIALLAGGAFLVIYTMRNKNNSPPPRRRPRRRED